MTTSMLNGYVCFYNGARHETYASSLYEAKCNAVSHFQAQAGRRKIKEHMVSVTLAEKAGKQVTHSL